MDQLQREQYQGSQNNGKIFWEQVAAKQIKHVNSTIQDDKTLKNVLMQHMAIPNDMIPILQKFI